MTGKIIVSLIALSDVILAIVMSTIISYIQTKRSEKNLKLELEKKFNEHLYKKRIEVYPKLYSVLSELDKNRGEANLRYLDVCLASERLEAWDSENAIFVSPTIIKLLFKIRKIFALTIENNPNSVVSAEDREIIFKRSLHLEQTLKNELGVYSLDGYHQHDIKNLPRWWYYKKERILRAGQKIR